MQVFFTKQFHREISKLKDKKVAKRLEDIIIRVRTAEHLSELDNLKKLAGFKNAYRIRLGDYRIGLFIESNNAVFSAFGHRKEIYRYFP